MQVIEEWAANRRRAGITRYSRPAVAALWCCVAVVAILFVHSLANRLGTPAAVGAFQPETTPIVYSVWVRNDLSPARLVVSIQAPVAAGAGSVRLQMPVWSPGDYHLQNHGQYVRGLHATGLNGSNQTGELKVDHTDPATWDVQTRGARSVLVTYYVPQTPAGIFSDNVTLANHFVFYNGPAALAYVERRTDSPTQLYVYAPSGWRVETALPTLPANGQKATAAFSAQDYDTLADSPLVAADSQGMIVESFEVDRVPHKAVFFHNPPDEQTAAGLVAPIKQIVQAENDIMGGPPYSRYDFLFDVGGGGGGLEHLNSARILLWRGANARTIRSLVSHEFFHLWNVKRIRPATLGPFDYIHPPKTRNLWFAEGVTEYYAHIALRRANLNTESEFYGHWRNAIEGMQGNDARKRVTADEASLRVWESGDSQGFGGLSYYDKGEMIGLCLDLEIRHVTNGKKSLDDVMRLLLARHNPPKPGYGEDEIRSVVSEVAGQDLSAFYDLLARSTEEMPFAQCLDFVGLDTSLRPLPNASAQQIALRASWSAANTGNSKLTVR
jgi:predicted metalloprotease with PDZ domain